MTPFAIPPQGGCSWANVSGTFTSSYLNGALVSVDAPYQSSVSCTVTGPDQSMVYMSDIARVYRSGTDVSYGTLGECDEADGPCTFAFSTGEYNCFLYAVCVVIGSSCLPHNEPAMAAGKARKRSQFCGRAIAAVSAADAIVLDDISHRTPHIPEVTETALS